MNQNEMRAIELGMTYRKVDHTSEDIERLRKETAVVEPEHFCAACGKQLYNHFHYCWLCAEELNIANVSYRYWPDDIKMAAMDQRTRERHNLEWLQHVTDLYNDEDGYEVLTVQKIAYDNYARSYDDNTLDELLEKYEITEVEYETLTDGNLARLARHLNMNYDTAASKKRRLIEKLGPIILDMLMEKAYKKETGIETCTDSVSKKVSLTVEEGGSTKEKDNGKGSKTNSGSTIEGNEI